MDNQQTCGRTRHQHMQEHVTAHVTKALLLHPIPQLEAQTETVVYHGKMRYWNESNGEITMGPNREAHSFPAEDGVKPGLAGWESSEKPRDLGKVFTWGHNRVNTGGISLGWKCLGSGV